MGLFLLIVAVTAVIFFASTIYELIKWDVHRKESKIFIISSVALTLECCFGLIALGISAFINL